LSKDNRNYDFTEGFSEIRNEYDIILNIIKEGSSVLDLGCGNGDLLYLLKKQKNIVDFGVEISESGVLFCKGRGLNVIQGSIDKPLPFSDNQFDYSICNVTIQMLLYPEILISEMQRVSKELIISFPNFAYFKNRLELLFFGRMPQKQLFGYNWYNTGHIHQFSLKDFIIFINESTNLKIIEVHHLKTKNKIKNTLLFNFENLFQQIPIVHLKKYGK